jgi:hypothetical protein
VGVIDGRRFAGDVGGPGQTVLRLRPVPEPVVHAVDGLPHADGRVGTHSSSVGVTAAARTRISTSLRPAIPPDAKRMARLISDLDSEVFKVREEAKRELEKLGDVAAPTLHEALTGKVSLEHKQRLESILKSYSTFQRLRTLRAVQALELLGTQPSRELLGRLADGVAEALVTHEAKAALDRLAKRGI